jgi:phage shock protein C
MARGRHGARLGPMNDTYDTETTTPKLRRSRDDRMVAGVCGGIAKMVGVDTPIIRILLVAATLLGFGAGAILYLVAWMVVPEA